MRLRSARIATLLLTFSAAHGLAQTPCDLLPATGTRVETVSKPGPTAPLGPRGSCPPFWHVDGSVCRGPDVQEAKTVQTSPRDDCERGLRISISQVKDLDGLPLSNNVIRKPGPVKLLVEGDGIANATSAQIGGGIAVTVGEAARRLGATMRGTCLPPNCQVVQLENLANAPAGQQTLTLFTPHRYASASVLLAVDNAAPVVVPDSLPPGRVTILDNLNDCTSEGLRYPKLKAFSVQHHPEAAPGPHEAAHLFDEFIVLMDEGRMVG